MIFTKSEYTINALEKLQKLLNRKKDDITRRLHVETTSTDSLRFICGYSKAVNDFIDHINIGKEQLVTEKALTFEIER